MPGAVLAHLALSRGRVLAAEELASRVLATFAAERGSMDLAEMYVRELIASCDPSQEYSRAHADIAMALLALRRGDPDEADRHTRDAMHRFRSFGDLAWLSDCLMLAADAAVQRREWQRAALLVGARRRLLPGADPESRMEEIVLRTRAALGGDFDGLVAEGASVPTEAALRLLDRSV